MSTAAKRIGRPVKTPAPGKRAPISLLVPPALKARIGKLAEKNGRTLAAETEALIEKAFAYEKALISEPNVRAGALTIASGTAVAAKGEGIAARGEGIEQLVERAVERAIRRVLDELKTA